MYRVRIEIPSKNADPKVADAIGAFVTALGVAPGTAEVVPDAPENTYGVTVHAFPDEKEK